MNSDADALAVPFKDAQVDSGWHREEPGTDAGQSSSGAAPVALSGDAGSREALRTRRSQGKPPAASRRNPAPSTDAYVTLLNGGWRGECRGCPWSGPFRDTYDEARGDASAHRCDAALTELEIA